MDFRIGLPLVGLCTLSCGADDAGGGGSSGSGDGPSTSSGPSTSMVTTMSVDTSTGLPTGDGSSSAGDGSSSTAAESSSGSTSSSSSGGQATCDGVDLLFVVDNSGSMGPHQVTLVNNFPGFISTIEQLQMDIGTPHVGVVTTDAYAFNLPGCDVLGGLVGQTGGFDSSNMTCAPYADGNNFMTENDDLGAAFACAAQVGTQGSGIEAPMDAMRSAVGDMFVGVGLCNEGFIRENAVLAVVILTDEADGPGDTEGSGSSGMPSDWFADVVAVKGGREDRVAVLSAINFAGGPCPPPTSFEDGQNILDFTEMFTYGTAGGICEASYAPYLSQLADNVALACAGFFDE